MLLLLAVGASTPAAALTPGRSVTRPSRIVALSVTGLSVVYAVGETQA